MLTHFTNAYEDARYAASYAKLEISGTYYLAFRDLPALFRAYVEGSRAVDFGCGAGRSTRFLRAAGFDVIGIDVAPEMLARARELDPKGDYRLVSDADYSALGVGAFDLVFSAFTFDNVPTLEHKVRAMRGIARLLAPRGRFLNLVSSPELYTHEWTSFSTKDFRENPHARAGDIVRCVNIALDDRRAVDDVLWPDSAYRETYELSDLELVATHRPLGRKDEPIAWVNEERIAPWVIYVLKPQRRRGSSARYRVTRAADRVDGGKQGLRGSEEHVAGCVSHGRVRHAPESASEVADPPQLVSMASVRPTSQAPMAASTAAVARATSALASAMRRLASSASGAPSARLGIPDTLIRTL